MKDIELKSRLKAHAEVLRQSVSAPFGLEKIIEETEIKEMNNKGIHTKLFKKIAFSALGMAAAFMLIFNCIPNLAYALSDVPLLRDVIRVVTFGRFEFQEDGYEAKVITPKIEGLLDKELEEKLNAEFQENADAVIGAFEKDVKELKEAFGEDTIHLGVEANYIVRTDNENVLAIDSYIINMAGSSYTKHSFYNIDKKTGTLIELNTLFKKNADYVTPISQYIISEMRKQNETDYGYFWIGKQEEGFDGFEKIKEDQNFFINDKGNIVICFDKYEVAAGAQGCPEFEIPNEVIKNILK